MATVDDVRPGLLDLERAVEVHVRGRLKFRVGPIVFVAFSLDEQTMGFGFPKLERQALVDGDSARFMLPRPSDMRFNWVECVLADLDRMEARELVVDAWRMVVPQKLQRAWDERHPTGPPTQRLPGESG